MGLFSVRTWNPAWDSKGWIWLGALHVTGAHYVNQRDGLEFGSFNVFICLFIFCLFLNLFLRQGFTV